MQRTGPVVLAMLLAMPAHAETACTARSAGRIVPLVELYTSEGCSDCPPADAWLSSLARRSGSGDASLLAFHVDYWDAIGWPDRFAAPLHGQRQDLRVRLSQRKAIYTPQVMIGARTGVDWRNADGVRRSLREARSDASAIALGLRVALESDGLHVAFDAAPAAGASALPDKVWIWIALYQDGLVGKVEAGENRNLTLRHDRVVRFLQGPWNLGGRALNETLRIPLQQDVAPRNAGLVLFAESGVDGAGLQSLELRLSDCGVAGEAAAGS